jgi:L-ascorbate metabolism protein UlaG (beta-lactamase superfamily)
MEVTWHGHAFFELQTAGGNEILVDPFVENGQTSESVGSFDPDLVLLTHGHDDHIGSTTELDAPVVSNFEIVTYLQQAEGISEDSVTMNTGAFHEVADVELYMTPAMHSSSVDAEHDHRAYAGHPNGFIVDDGETSFYHMGDTGLFGDLKHVIRDVLEPDAAAVPIGNLFTMNPEHAAIAVDWMDVDAATPCHYDTFPAIEQDPTEFAKRVGGAADVAVPDVDESFSLEGGEVASGGVRT